MNRLGSGTTACLVSGTYNWGDYTVPSGKTIQGSNDAGFATVVGEARLSNSDVTLSDLKLQASATENHAVVDGKASNITLQHLDVNTNMVGGVQGMIIGGASVAPSNFKVLDAIVRGARGGGGLSATQVHAIYWSNGSGSGNEIGRVWMYDVSGYGLHFYGGGSTPATNVDIHHTVLDDSINRGHVFDGPTGNTLSESVVTDSPSGVVCRTTGNTLTNVRSEAGFVTPSNCTTSGLVIASTTYQDEANRDYRTTAVTGHDFSPGPRF
jgi:hypothetical protein